MSTNVFAAGWTTSRSFRMVAPSFEMVALPVMDLDEEIKLGCPKSGPQHHKRDASACWGALQTSGT